MSDLRSAIKSLVSSGKTLAEIIEAVGPEHDSSDWHIRRVFAEVKKEQDISKVEDIEFTPPPKTFSKKGIEALNAGWLKPVKMNFDLLPPSFPRTEKIGRTIGVISDPHYPDQDDNAIDLMFQIGRYVGIDELIINGDLFDCSSLSKYIPSAEQHLRWVDERAEALQGIVKIRQSFPTIPIRFLPGNHDVRPEKWINSNAVPLQNLFPLEHWLGIDDPKLGIEVVKDGSIMLAEGNLMVKHGTYVGSNSGDSVRKAIDRTGFSTVIGHSHRMCQIEVTRAAHELVGIELGCLQNLRPSYLPPEETANWQQGFAIITELGEGKFGPELVRIKDGRAFYRGKQFVSRLL